MVIYTLQYDARYTQRHIYTLQYDARYTQRQTKTYSSVKEIQGFHTDGHFLIIFQCCLYLLQYINKERPKESGGSDIELR